MIKNYSKIESLLKYSSWLLAFLTLCGFLKFYIYYKQFGIYILPFLELSEIIVLFLDNLIAYLSIILPATIVSYLLYRKCIDTFTSNKISLLSKRYFGNWRIPTVGFVVVVALIFWTWGYTKKVSILELLLQILFSLLILFIFPYLMFLVKFYTRKHYEDVAFRIIYLFGICSILIIASILFAFNEAKKIKNQKHQSAKIELQNETVSNDYVILGMTKNYLLLYNLVNKSTLVIPNKELKSIVNYSVK